MHWQKVKITCYDWYARTNFWSAATTTVRGACHIANGLSSSAGIEFKRNRALELRLGAESVGKRAQERIRTDLKAKLHGALT